MADPIKISDFLPASEFGSIDARDLIDSIGDYMRDQIAEVHTLNVGAYACDVPTQIKINALVFANSLPVEKNTDYKSDDESVTITITSYPKQEMLDALNDPTTNFSKFLTVLETTFNTTQGACIILFNTPNGSPPPPLLGPELNPYTYIDNTFYTAINTALLPATEDLLAQAVEDFIKEQYDSEGTS